MRTHKRVRTVYYVYAYTRSCRAHCRDQTTVRYTAAAGALPNETKGGS